MFSKKKEKTIKIGLLLGDVVITQIALFLALFLRNRQLVAQFKTFSYHFVVVYGIWILIIFILNLYDIYFFKKPVDFLFNIIIFSVTTFFLSITYFYFIPIPSITPKTILFLNIIIFSFFFFAWRYGADIFLKRFFPYLFTPLGSANAGDAYELMNKKIALEYVTQGWISEKIPNKENRIYVLIKRGFDVIISLLGLFLCAVLFPFIALAIKLDSRGGVFYHQKRVGKNGNVFTITKFRTMQDNDSQQQELWREKNKNNITFVGNIFRRLHLDELPQAWPMLKGEISFVGPRPEWVKLAEMFEKEIPFYKQRYLVKPGIIGWAQINFPPSHSLEEAREKFQYDLYYIKNRSLLLDFEIILKATKLFLW